MLQARVEFWLLLLCVISFVVYIFFRMQWKNPIRFGIWKLKQLKGIWEMHKERNQSIPPKQDRRKR